MKTNVILLISLLSSSWGFCAELRTWTNTEGKSVTGSFVDAVMNAEGQATAAKVRLSTGQVYTLDLAKLTEADQQYVVTAVQEKAASEEKAKLGTRRAKWTDDWEKAQAESKETGLPILLFMTGSDWCGYCVSLKAKVIESREFQKYANTNLVLMEADFPHAAQSKSLKEQNGKLKSQFPFGGYPTVMIIKDGKKVGELGGYGGDSPKEYIEKLTAKAR